MNNKQQSISSKPPIRPFHSRRIGACLFLSLSLLTGCAYGALDGSTLPPDNAAPIGEEADGNHTGTPIAPTQSSGASVTFTPGTPDAPPEFEVDPETFSLILKDGDVTVTASLPGERRQVADYQEQNGMISWNYPQEQLAISITPEDNYLDVSITSLSEEDHDFFWPNISGDTYCIPFGEGKRIPAGDEIWNNHLAGNEYPVIEQLSMPFWTSVSGEHAVMYLTEQPSRSSLHFLDGEKVSFSLRQDFPAILPEKKQHLRIYLTDDDPVTAAKLYRSYVNAKGRLVTLEQKAEQNPDIRKLYGAPHIYLWGDLLITPEDIDWNAFRLLLKEHTADGGQNRVLTRILERSGQTENAAEATNVFSRIPAQDYVDQYQKLTVCRTLSEILKKKDFYDSSLFQYQAESTEELQWMERNKQALAAEFPQVFKPASDWASEETTTLIKDWNEAGIQNAWVGLNNWEQAYAKPDLVKTAVEQGYLVGPYDSYHSIHEPGKEQWNTAAFGAPTLYETATVTDKNGDKISGFQNVGRKLNPVLSLPSVRKRTEEVLDTVPYFNSWFIDCDATGEIYDDYSPDHVTTKEEDKEARLERMRYIRDQHGMVIGSEGGNDFAAADLAFAHGIELPSFSWIDPDMKSNKDSEYYIGRYYSASGGVAEHFAKQIPVKEHLYHVYVDPRFDLPLYKLVYNDAMITAYHWDWSTYKIKGASNDRMLREVLYNTPPLYHLDREQWELYKDSIISHLTVWAPFSREAVLREMTGFQLLADDGSVQQTSYGSGLTVTANFGETSFEYGGELLPPHSLLLEQDGVLNLYQPES